MRWATRPFAKLLKTRVVCTRYSGSRGCVLHMLGAVPRTATDDDLHPKSPVDRHTARDPESSLLCLRYMLATPRILIITQRPTFCLLYVVTSTRIKQLILGLYFSTLSAQRYSPSDVALEYCDVT